MALTARAAPLPATTGPPARRGTTLTGAVLVVVAGTMLMGGLLAAYFAARNAAHASGGKWGLASPDMPNAALAVTYGALFLSSFTAQWAVSAIKVGERRQTYVAIGTTMLLGVAFVNGLTFCYTQLKLVAGKNVYANLVYAVSGTHLLLVVAALVLFVVVGFRVLGGQQGTTDPELVVAAVTVWHFVVFAGVAVWWCLWFLTGGPG
jgi:heme/copper-type cytochrome/quinol oxidase subunit 3